MDESTVFTRVAEWLTERDYRVFVHVPTQHHSHGSYGEIIDRWPSHNVTISGYRPDILGFTPTDSVFAVEVKGSSGIRKGFGQAVSYRRGVDHAYLAASDDALKGFADIAHANGVGVLAVRDGDISPTHPHTIDLRDQLSNTRQQLDALLSDHKYGDTFLPNYRDPLNNLLPIVAIGEHACRRRSDIDDLCERIKYPYRSKVGRMIRMSRKLGLVGIDEPFELTDQGRLCWTVLQGSDLHTAQALIDAKDKSLKEEFPLVATFLQNRFAAVPEYRTLFEILLRHPDSTITLQQLCERLLTSYPNTFLNLAYSNYTDERDAPRLIEEGRTSQITDDSEYLAQILNTNFTYNLPAQLEKIGILSDGTNTIDSKAKLSPSIDHWAIGNFELG